jgi:adenylosuccinate synthase
MLYGRLNFVTGCQYGSEGKGKIAGYLARKYDVYASICSFSSQAGHTHLDERGRKVMVQQIPMAVVNPNTKLLISQGAIIDMDILRKEIEQHGLNEDRLSIHPKAIVIKKEHKDYEALQAEGPRRIASTCKGNGAAMAEFVLRKPKVKYVSEFTELKPFLRDTRSMINSFIDDGKLCMGECAQGYSLDIYQGYYPYVTSRTCTPVGELSRIGVASWKVGRIYGVYRTYPIRVGNIVEESLSGKDSILGFSGGCYPDQKEVTWDEVTKYAKSVKPLLERTTVTQRVRRVFTFSEQQFKESLDVVGVTDVCLCFVDYLDNIDFGKTDYNGLSMSSHAFIEKLKDVMAQTWMRGNIKMSLLSTGPKIDDTIDMIEGETP